MRYAVRISTLLRNWTQLAFVLFLSLLKHAAVVPAIGWSRSAIYMRHCVGTYASEVRNGFRYVSSLFCPHKSRTAD